MAKSCDTAVARAARALETIGPVSQSVDALDGAAQTLSMVPRVTKTKGWAWLDPSLPIFPAGLRQTRQYLKSSAILALARSRLSQYGFDRVCVRDLARESDVSPQTLYNLVGGKRTLLGTAVAQWISHVAAQACLCNGLPNNVIALGETYALAASLHSAFMREATLAYFPPRRPLQGSIVEASIRAVLLALADLRARHVLRPRINERDFATTLTLGWGVDMMDCLTLECDIAKLRYRILVNAERMLSGAVTSEEARAVERWISHEIGSRT